ncbi:MAG: hypothetical protein HYZ18_08260 [Pseudogulbenkiania sp.]|nr:hypothetical protein [Pseudogulbenkiania sp.]
MKKPGAKKTESKKEEGSKVTSQVLGKVLDIGKELASTGNNLIDWGKEKERTKQVVAEASGKVAEAKETTRQVELDANVRITDIHRNHHKDVMDHEHAMARLHGEREDARARNRERERLLDKLLDEPQNQEQVAEQYRALIAEDKSKS